MSYAIRAGFLLTAIAAITAFVPPAAAQSNPYRQVEGQSPPADMNGGRWGELIGVDVDTQGNVWVLHRCFKAVLGHPRVIPGHSDGQSANCLGPWAVHPPIMKFSPSGEFLTSFGEGLLGRPHGLAVDHEGNVWAVDDSSEPGVGHAVYKFSSSGELLLTLGRVGIAGDGVDTFNRPTDVAVAPNGEIFVTDGHGQNNRVVKFSSEGDFVGSWGSTGSEPGNFNQPHTIAIDSQGRVFVGDRGNSRVQIFDEDGNFLDEWTQFGRPSGISINRTTDMLYVTDSTSNSRSDPGVKRGIYIGSAVTGEVAYFIPDPDLEDMEWTRITGASGIAADATDRVVYAADVAPIQLRKYVRP